MKSILLKITVGLALFSMLGCTQHIGNFTALSSSTFRGENIDSKHMVKQNAEGDACSLSILGIPVGGIPKVDQAVSEALSQNNGDIMTNARLYNKAWTAILFGQMCWVVQGDVYKTSN
jgi:hypothetical protein